MQKIEEIIWIDARVNNNENTKYKDQISKFMQAKFSCYEQVPPAIIYLKQLQFIPTYIICSGRLYPEFIKEFKTKIKEFSICPKIIIFCGSSKSYLEMNKNNHELSLNHPFYNSGGVIDKYEDLEKFLTNKESINIESKTYEPSSIFEEKFNFEFISDQNHLILPLFLSDFMQKPQEEEIRKFNEYCFQYYSDSNELKSLFEQLLGVKNIPNEILCKYWLKAYSYDILNQNINEALKSDNLEKFIVFIQVIYEGLKSQIPFQISDDIDLYRYCTLSKHKIDNMQIILSKDKNNLPPILIYSETFLSFYLNKKDAKKNNSKKDNNVLLIIEKANENLYSGYTSLETYNSYKKNEIFLFPFFFFEILKIKIKSENQYQIYLGCLKKYKNLFNANIKSSLISKIPGNSSLTKEILKLDLIDDEYKDEFNIISIKYSIKTTKKFQILGKKFVTNNKDKCFLLINGQKSEIKEELELDDSYNNAEEFEIKLVGLNRIKDISNIFNGCKNLIELPNISKLDTRKITNMSSMFKSCSNLKSFPDLSKWNTSNVTDISFLFAKCASIEKFPNISKWNVGKVINMCSLFDSCTSLKILPDISKWDVSKVIDMSFMFYDLPNLEHLPDISNWNINSVTNMSSLFEKCSKIVSLPDISKWNIENVTNISCMFYLCKSLNSLPDISKWKLHESINMDNMFYGLKEEIVIPDKFKNKKI